ncbi:MAG: hypothetical protein ACM3PT_08050 [Deltaproteobacteria bacterium]
MRNIKNFSIIVMLSAFAIALIQCSKENIEVKNTEALELRNTGSLLDFLGTSCVPGIINVGVGCNDEEYIDTLVINDLPNYPGCTFKIIYKRYECEALGLKDVTIGDFQILEHNCQQYSNDLNNAYNGRILSNFVINFELSVWNKIRDHIITKYVVGNAYPCGSSALFQINFIRSSCYRIANYNQGNGLGVSTKITCGSQCCERHTFVCTNPDGSLFIVEEDETGGPINCSDPPFLSDPPNTLGRWRLTWVSDCMVLCPGN